MRKRPSGGRAPGARGDPTDDDEGTHGSSSDAVDGKVHFHDLHATILHLLGLDHLKLTYRHAGRDFRLTDVSGEVVRAILG